MLEEGWHWLRIDTLPAAQRLGYRREAAALRTRHRRCAAAWQEHLLRTRAMLLESARRAQVGAGGRALVLGAGLPRDVPWPELIELYDELVLVDVAFHPEARAAQRRSGGRIRLVALDVTGQLDRLAGDAPQRRPRVHEVHADLRALLSESRWVASVNLLTQLALLPCSWLRKRGHQEEQVDGLAEDILCDHLTLLAQASASVCVVTEEAERVRDAGGRLIERSSRADLLDARLPPPHWQRLGRWQWLVNPPGELSGGLSESRDVVALHRDGADGSRSQSL